MQEKNKQHSSGNSELFFDAIIVTIELLIKGVFQTILYLLKFIIQKISTRKKTKNEFESIKNYYKKRVSKI